MTGLDALLAGMNHHATFHDASLLALRVDYAARTLSARLDLCVGDPDAGSREEREVRRAGVLELTGLLYWVQEPPGDGPAGGGTRLPRLTADGPLADAPTGTGKRLAGELPAGAWSCYMYFSDTNSFAYCAAGSASFRWLECA
jgi:hypothetical protein